MKCPTCIGTGGSVAETVHPTSYTWAFVPGACPDCEGTGCVNLICKHCKHPAERFGPVGMWQHCPDHEGGSLTHEWVESRPPDPCPACGFFGHAMSIESVPGPLCPGQERRG